MARLLLRILLGAVLPQCQAPAPPGRAVVTMAVAAAVRQRRIAQEHAREAQQRRQQEDAGREQAAGGDGGEALLPTEGGGPAIPSPAFGQFSLSVSRPRISCTVDMIGVAWCAGHVPRVWCARGGPATCSPTHMRRGARTLWGCPEPGLPPLCRRRAALRTPQPWPAGGRTAPFGGGQRRTSRGGASPLGGCPSCRRPPTTSRKGVLARPPRL